MQKVAIETKMISNSIEKIYRSSYEESQQIQQVNVDIIQLNGVVENNSIFAEDLYSISGRLKHQAINLHSTLMDLIEFTKNKESVKNLIDITNIQEKSEGV